MEEEEGGGRRRKGLTSLSKVIRFEVVVYGAVPDHWAVGEETLPVRFYTRCHGRNMFCSLKSLFLVSVCNGLTIFLVMIINRTIISTTEILSHGAAMYSGKVTSVLCGREEKGLGLKFKGRMQRNTTFHSELQEHQDLRTFSMLKLSFR